MPNDSQGWCATTFTKADLDGKRVFFTMPSDNQYYTGNFHVLAQNSAGQLQIEIDYGRPLPDGTAVSGLITIDQSWVDQLALNPDPNISTEFIIHPLH
jgi:hypothetical protein